MRDLSKIKDAASANQAIKETEEAIAKGKKAIKDEAAASSPAVVQSLEDELEAIKKLKRDKGWK